MTRGKGLEDESMGVIPGVQGCVCDVSTFLGTGYWPGSEMSSARASLLHVTLSDDRSSALRSRLVLCNVIVYDVITILFSVEIQSRNKNRMARETLHVSKRFFCRHQTRNHIKPGIGLSIPASVIKSDVPFLMLRND